MNPGSPWSALSPAIFRAALEEHSGQRQEKRARPPEISEVRQRFREAATVLVDFEPAALRAPGVEAPPGAAFQHLVQDCESVRGGRAAVRWRLRPEIRKEALTRLRSPEAWLRMLEANPDRSQDVPQRIFEAWMRGGAPALHEQNVDELAATLQAVEWLSGLRDGLPSPVEVQQRLEQERLLEPLEFLLRNGFFGRQTEMQRLRDFVGVLPPEDLLSFARRQWEAWRKGERRDPLGIHGIGGIGKSTLIAKFVVEHARAPKEFRFPYVYLNFDNPLLHVDEPLTLLTEALRQLAVQSPDHRGRCESLRDALESQLGRQGELRRSQAELETTQYVREGAKISTEWVATEEDAFDAFGQLLREVARRESAPASGGVLTPCLLVLDTFEEVQYENAAHLESLWRLLSRVQVHCPTLRVVVSGRAPIAGLHLSGQTGQQYELGELDGEAAAQMLVGLGVADYGLAERVARQLGRNPLTMKLAAEILRRHELSSGDPLSGLPARRWLFFTVKETAIQGQLYRRILEHLHSDEAKALAHPGLVVRKLTPEVILHVLAEPCGVAVRDRDHARELFEQLSREAALVIPSPDGSLRHRPDVRRGMLAMLRHDKPEETRGIDRKAVEYYTKLSDESGDPEDRAEEIYHRLQLNQDKGVIDQRWTPEAGEFLRTAIEELPNSGKTFLASRLGLELPGEVWEEADLEEWERHTAKSAELFLKEGAWERAISLINEREGRSLDSPLYALEAEGWLLAGDIGRAEQVLGEALSNVSESGSRENLLKLLMLSAEAAERRGDAAAAGERLRQAAEVAAKGGSLAESIDIGVKRLRLSRRLGYEMADRTALIDALAAAFLGIPETQIYSLSTLARRLGGEIGAERPDVLARVLDIAGLGNLGEREQQWFAEALTQATEGDATLPAADSMSEGVRVEGGRNDFWRRQVAQAADRGRAGALAIRVIEQHPGDHRLHQSLAELLRRGSEPEDASAKGEEPALA